MTFSTKEYIAAGIIAQFKDLVLLGRRSKNCHNLAGYWSMPCGMIEPGEDPKEAARREFFEETGVLANKPIKFIGDFAIKNQSFFAAYLMELDDLIFPSSEAIDSIEHDEWGFYKACKNSLPTPIGKETRNIILNINE
jgi:8-oxo-dGTP pyrophosphatase MutT (NUDIX family)